MNIPWEETHRRNAVLRDLILHEETRGPIPQQGDLDESVPGLAAEFPERGDLLRALQQRWVTVLNTCLDNVMELSETSPVDDVRRAYEDAVTAAPALRRLLDRFSEHPVLARLIETEHQKVAVSAGLARPGRPLHESSVIVAELASQLPRRKVPRPVWWRRMLLVAT